MIYAKKVSTIILKSYTKHIIRIRKKREKSQGFQVLNSLIVSLPNKI
jgi:hypothetical protein